METKSIFKSKTFWFNLLLTLVGGAAAVSAPDIADLGLSAVASAWVLKICGAVAFMGNFYLRLVTNQPVTLPTRKNTEQ
jgi:hypothetical protein